MGFDSFRNSTPNPAQRFYKWSGGLKDIKLPDGTTAKQPRGELRYFDGEEMQSVPLPMRFCALEQTYSVTGFDGQGVSFYSNEVTSLKDERLVVNRKTPEGTSVVFDNFYNKDTRTSLPNGAKFQTNLYVYNPDTQRIERFNMHGSCLSAWIEFSKAQKGKIYEHAVSISQGEKKNVGSVEFVAPKFALDQKYGDEEIKLLSDQDKIVIEYLKTRREANLNRGEFESGSGSGAIDQTPAQYDGEGSQEQAAQNQEDQEISFDDIPF